MRKLLGLSLVLVMLTLVCGSQIANAQATWVFTGPLKFTMTFTGEDKTNPSYPLTGFKKLVNSSLALSGQIIMTQPLADNGSGVMVPSGLASITVALDETTLPDPGESPILIDIDIPGPDGWMGHGTGINSRGNGTTADQVRWRYNCNMVLTDENGVSHTTNNATLFLTGTRPRLKSTPSNPTGIYKIALSSSTLGGGINIDTGEVDGNDNPIYDKFLFKSTFSSVLTRPLP